MKIHGRFVRLFMVLFLFLFLLSALYQPAQAGTVVVKPGQFDHFTVQLPDKALAGENFIVKVQAYDLNNNLITNFIDSGKEFRIDAGGSAVVQPMTLSAASFSGGSANISINSRKAEKVVISIREAGGTVPVISREVLVTPNKLEHFILQAPTTVRAGTRFDIRIIAKDLFDNTVDDVEIGRNLKVTASGTASPGMIGGSGIDFKNGTAVATFISEKAGNSFIELQELTSGSRGRSNEVAVTPSVLSLFKVQAPKTATAGEPFDLIISAYDAFDNLINTYASSGAGASLTTTGSTKIEPSSLAPTDFKQGQAVVRAVYEKAEDITVLVKDANSDRFGKTGDIQIVNAAPDHFVVVTPDSAVSGQRFKIKVEAYDRFNNVVRNYNLAGNEVVLSTSGTSYITPSVILPTEFISGIAVVDVLYDRAESFTISAKMIGEKRPGKMTITEKEQKRETVSQRTVTPVVEKPRSTEKTMAETTPARAEEKRPEARKPEVKKSEPKKTEAKKAEPRKEVPAKTEEKKPEEKVVQKPAEQKKEKPLQQPEVKQAEKKPVEQKQEKPKQPEKIVEEVKPLKPVEVAKKEEKKPEPKKPEPKKIEAKKTEPKPEIRPDVKAEAKADQLTAVSKIAAIEAKNKAMLVINLSDVQSQFEYRDAVETRSGKEWLKLALKPAVRKTEKAFKFKSSFVGDVLVEEDRTGQNAVNIYIELLPAGVTFDIERIRNTLIVTLSRP
ncbi:MAG: hypothetical protein C0402_00335 [Thermodesulfovibrio sp.]|nr:hypothetical protein [Thermodesulfovibrio sp.]